MSNEKETLITYLFIITAIFTFGYLIGYGNGYTKGYDKSTETQDRLECESKYSYKPYKDISGKCLKYFTNEKD